MLRRILHVALAELSDAVRSRRAIVLLSLYLLSAVGCMYGTISIFEQMETELVSLLSLPKNDETGVVSATLWKSQPFQRMVKAVVANDLVYHDIQGRHPIELVSAWFSFLLAPLLVILVSGNRIADDVKSGAVRYSIVRCTRGEWTLGKYAGQAGLILSAIIVSSVAAWCVAICRLSSFETCATLPPMLAWGLRAWIYSLAWLGVALCASLLSRSGSRATSLGILLVVFLSILPQALHYNAKFFEYPWLENFELFMPSSAKMYLWRAGFVPFAVATVHLLSLGLSYLMLGYLSFSRRDA